MTVPLLVALVMAPFQALLGAVVAWLELPGRIVGLHFAVSVLPPLGTTESRAGRHLALAPER